MNAVERLEAINAARDKARAEHPDVVRFLDEWRAEFPNGRGHFYPKGRAFLEANGVTVDRMMLKPLAIAKKKEKRSLKERNIK